MITTRTLDEPRRGTRRARHAAGEGGASGSATGARRDISTPGLPAGHSCVGGTIRTGVLFQYQDEDEWGRGESPRGGWWPVRRTGRWRRPSRPAAPRVGRRADRHDRRGGKDAATGGRGSGPYGALLAEQQVTLARKPLIGARGAEGVAQRRSQRLGVRRAEIRRLVPGEAGADVVNRPNPFGRERHEYPPMIGPHPRSSSSPVGYQLRSQVHLSLDDAGG